MEIDRDAPVTTEAHIHVQAEREIVWEVLSDFAGWPQWNDDIEEMAFEGRIEPGAEFGWRSGRARIRSRLETVDPPHEIGWTGRTLGIKAVDVYRLERDDHGTHVVQRESWAGWPARLMRRRLGKMLQQAIEKGLQALKAEAERRSLQRQPPRRRVA